MKLQPETIRLRNGQTCILRSLEVEEAEKMIHFLKQAYTETERGGPYRQKRKRPYVMPAVVLIF